MTTERPTNAIPPSGGRRRSVENDPEPARVGVGLVAGDEEVLRASRLQNERARIAGWNASLKFMAALPN